MISVIISPAKCPIASACNNPSGNITETRYLGTVELLQTKTKSYMLTWRLRISCPQPRFRGRDLHVQGPISWSVR